MADATSISRYDPQAHGREPGASLAAGSRSTPSSACSPLIYLLPLFVVVLNSFRELPEIAAERPDRLAAQLLARTPGPQAWSTYCVGGTCEGIQRNFFNSLKMTIPATIISTADRRDQRLHPVEMALPRLGAAVRLHDARRLHAGPDRADALGLHPRQARPHQHRPAGLVLIHAVQGLSFTTLFCRNYYVNIPDDLIKAARIDGAGFWRIFRKIILPLSPPILIVTVIWQFTGIWNEFLFGVVFTSGTPAADHRGAGRALDQRHERAHLRRR